MKGYAVLCLTVIAALALVHNSAADPKTLPLMQVKEPFFGIVYSASSNSTAHAIFQKQFNEFTADGANIYSISFTWQSVSEGSVNASVYLDVLKLAQLPPVTVLKTIDTTQLQLPSQFVQSSNRNLLLDGLLFNDSAIIDSFKTTIDRVLPSFLGAGGFVIGVGNEVDVYLSYNEYQQKPFLDFVKAAKDYIHSTYNEDIAVGVVITYEGLQRYHENDPAYAFVRYFLEVSDVAMFSYYPPNHHIEHTETVVRAAFDVMKSPLGDKLFLFTEIGYPSGYPSNSKLNTSQAKQALFFESFFKVIANEPHAKGFSIVQLNDWSQQQCDLFNEEYGINTPEFAEFLCTLGLMTETATAKSSLASVLEYLALLRNGSLIEAPTSTPNPIGLSVPIKSESSLPLSQPFLVLAAVAVFWL